MANNKKKAKQPSSKRAGAISAGLLALVVLGAVILGAVCGRSGGVRTDAAFDLSVSASSPIQLSEIMSSNASTMMQSDGSLPDWIEVVNTGSREVSLAGFALIRGDDPAKMYRFPSVILPAGGYLVVLADGKSSAGELHAPFKIASSGDRISLLNAAGAVVDSVTTPKLDKDQVYCRGAKGDWQTSSAPTPGEANRVAGAGEALAAEAPASLTSEGSVTVTEIMSRNASYYPDENGLYQDYVELTNTSDAPVSLKDWFLSDDKGNVARWQFPDVSVPAGGCLVVYCSGEDRKEDPNHLHASFRLSGDGSSVVLTRNDGVTASLVDVPALETDQAYSLRNGAWTDDFAPTPGLANTVENAASAAEAIRQKNPSGVVISEISASTTTVNADWVELYNSGAAAVDLSGYGLSDNAARPRKWQFPQGTTIQPGEYLGILCSGLDTVQSGYMHTNFKLSADGGYTMTLSQPDGTIIDHAFVPQQYEDITYGRVLGRDGFYFFTLPTPRAVNDGVAYLGRASLPEYSVRGGLYATGDSLSVTLTAAPGARIYYTLDCSDPTESSALYTGPIHITSTTILRTRVYQEGYLESFMDTQSYLYDVNNAGVYVVSLVSDMANLTDEDTGIMIKGKNASDTFPYQGANYWQDWEREAHVEVYGGDGSEVISSECGIKLHGQYSRAEKQQAFKVIARTKYGDNRFHAALFANRDYTEYQSFVLRSSGQDTDKTRMRDSVLTALAKDTSVMYQETEICVLYLDGYYWGQYNIRERVNADSVCQFEGWEGEEDDIDLVKANSNTKQGSNETFEALLAWVKKTDPTSDSFYATLDKAIDIRNYIEYMAVEIFVGNGDTLNVKRYRNANADGKWRWVLFDLDWAFIVDTNSINRWLTPGGMGTNLYTDNTLFIACMKNPQFRDEFLTYMGQEMATTFSTENVIRLIRERYEILKPLLPEQLERWGQTQESYQEELQFMIDYAETRPLKLLKYFSTTKYLNLSTEDMYHYFGDALEVIQNYGK